MQQQNQSFGFCDGQILTHDLERNRHIRICFSDLKFRLKIC